LRRVEANAYQILIIKIPNPHDILVYNLQTLDKAVAREIEAGTKTSPVLWRNPIFIRLIKVMSPENALFLPTLQDRKEGDLRQLDNKRRRKRTR
jgi:hypothetical protein